MLYRFGFLYKEGPLLKESRVILATRARVKCSHDVKRFSSEQLASNFHSVTDTYIRLLREMEFESVRREQFVTAHPEHAVYG